MTGCFREDQTDDLRGAEDIYMPVDLDEAPKEEPGMSDEEKKEVRKVWKNRKAKARKIALEKVQTGIEGWKKSFEGSQDKYSGGKTKYFRVGSVKLTDEELKAREKRAKPVLCERAVKMRPQYAAELGIL